MLNLDITSNGKLAQITGDQNEFSHMREFFSIPNNSFSKNKKYFQPRKYAITPSGK
jgi:hypothetical protein